MARISVVEGRYIKEGFREWKYLLRDGRRLAAVFHDGDAALFAAAPDMLAALRKLEWSAESPRYGRMCPACESLQSEGEHEPDCYLVAAIAKAEARS